MNSPPHVSPAHRRLAQAALLAVVTAAIYWPALHGGFLLDDGKLLTENQLVQAPDGLYQFWATTNPADYWPVTNTSFWLEWRLWGANPTGYHVTNLLLHLAAALLIWAVLKQLKIPGAFFAAFLFAAHPVNVESVAWIAQRKNLLAIVFFLLSILSFLHDRKARSSSVVSSSPSITRWYWLSLFSFILAMLSKGSVAPLPFILLVLIAWQHRRISFRDFLPTIPFFLIALLLGAVNVWFQTHGFADQIRSATFAERSVAAGAIPWFYLSKSLLPIDLLFVYPQWLVQTTSILWWLPLLAAVGFTIVFWLKRRNLFAAAILFAWAYFCLALLPVLGFTDVGFMQFSLVADHYQHIAIIAVVAIVAAAVNSRRTASAPQTQLAAIALQVFLVVILSALTLQRAALFGNPVDLYATTLQANPACWQLRSNFAAALLQADKPQEAIQQARLALQSDPNNAEAHFNLALALQSTNQLAESLEHFQQALALRPQRAAEVHCAIASALLSAGRTDEAIEQCRLALELQPNDAEAHKQWGLALSAAGNNQAAIEQFREALKSQPDAAEVENNLGNSLARSGNPAEALSHYQRAVQLQPNFADAEGNWGAALVQLGQSPEAIAHLHRAVQLAPHYSEGHSNLGIALYSTGRLDEAIQQFQQSLQLKPSNAEAHFNLGILLAQTNRLPEAAQQFEQTVQLAPNNLAAYAKLAAAYDRLNQPEKAIAAAQQGLAHARAAGQNNVAEQIQQWITNQRALQTNPAPPPAQSNTATPTP